MRKHQQIVISASRRTDIPAFYMDWFMEQISRGEFEAINPFNQKAYKIPATPEKVSTIVFWSKNYDIFLNKEYGKKLEKAGYHLFFNFTINSEDTILEPGLPNLNERLEQIKILSETYGAASINWRFDPLIYYQKGKQQNDPLIDLDKIADAVSDVCIGRCITSFADMYGKVKKRFKKLSGIEILTLPDKKQTEILLHMEKALKKYDISLNLCCEKKLFDLLPKQSTIRQSACIDNHLLKDLFGDNLSMAKDTGQRKEMGCRCNKSYDIGSYSLQPCYHNCIYCYANPGSKKNRSNNIEY